MVNVHFCGVNGHFRGMNRPVNHKWTQMDTGKADWSARFVLGQSSRGLDSPGRWRVPWSPLQWHRAETRQRCGGCHAGWRSAARRFVAERMEGGRLGIASQRPSRERIKPRRRWHRPSPGCPRGARSVRRRSGCRPCDSRHRWHVPRRFRWRRPARSSRSCTAA